ncbi:hypothetical protein PIB30_083654 [Stylosanthes scabra]|uniref:Uncharacterized protein n=1 Tax=Stylosanthes scabra TaxID=79078 RepID=A0ABU6XS76_9FABA|nr:hypothetical protein [Stylosanthes scabra]
MEGTGLSLCFGVFLSCRGDRAVAQFDWGPILLGFGPSAVAQARARGRVHAKATSTESNPSHRELARGCCADIDGDHPEWDFGTARWRGGVTRVEEEENREQRKLESSYREPKLLQGNIKVTFGPCQKRDSLQGPKEVPSSHDQASLRKLAKIKNKSRLAHPKGDPNVMKAMLSKPKQSHVFVTFWLPKREASFLTKTYKATFGPSSKVGPNVVHSSKAQASAEFCMSFSECNSRFSDYYK